MEAPTMHIHSNEKLNSLIAFIRKTNKKFTQNKKIITTEINYNCWGFIATLFNWITEVRWLTCKEMDEFLKHNTIAVEEPEIGDIAEWRRADNGRLIHTALILEPNGFEIVHKPGPLTLEFGNYVDDFLETYEGKVSYRKAI